VLARLPDAPAGQRGISLFLVPKFLLSDDGEPGPRNDVYCHSLEHKLGIHASPTCTMIYGDGRHGEEAGAVGWLIGEENRGLACMFTMMNNARLLVGIQGVAVAESATQHARAYAMERKQGRAASYDGDGMAPIVHHRDVQRMLVHMTALTRSARCIAYNCAHALDQQAAGNDEADYWRDRAALLTPVAKAFSTDIGCEVASLGVQIHGGMGYVEETGAAQFLRDARIAPIYEGTNGIQAIDLVTRKLPLDDGRVVQTYLDELDAIAEQVQASNRAPINTMAAGLKRGLADLRSATDYLLEQIKQGQKDVALCGATPYLRLFGVAAGATYLAQSAMNSDATPTTDRAAVAGFMVGNLLNETTSLRASIEQGADSLLHAGDVLLQEQG